MKPVWKWIIAAVIGILMILAAGAWYLSKHWKPIVEAQLKEAVIHATDSLYHIEYDDLNFNLVTGNASIAQLRLIPDTQVYARREQQQRAPDNTYAIHIANLAIKGFYPRRIVRERRLTIDDIIVDTPAIHIVNTPHAYNDTATVKHDDRTLYQRIAHLLREISVKNMNVAGIQFKFTKRTDSATRNTELKDLNINVRDLLIDSVSQFDTSRFFHTRAIDVDMPGLRYETPDSFYYVSFDRLQVATLYKQVTLTGFRYAPRMSKAEFYKRKKVAADMAVIAFPSIRLEDIDLHRLVDSQKLHAGSLHIDSGTVAISNDLRYPKRRTNKIGKSPHQLLLQLKQPVTIDSVVLNDVAISYAEVSRKYKREGRITFDRSHGVFRNVTNEPAVLRKNGELVADLTTYVMNTGKLHVVFAFDMLDKQGAFTYKGTLGPMDGRPLNRIITPLLHAEVGSANIKGLSFDIKADDRRAQGRLRFDYSNMRLRLLQPEDVDKKSSMRVASFLANSFIINDSNPDANGKYHTGRINYRRDPTFSFFKMVWQSLLQGIKETAGVSPERERRLLHAAEEAKKASEKTQRFFNRIFRKREDNP
ncbi:hypothetical protein SAMN05421747_109123 [Parapedobacter composti]|uniref:DUF748 domain-containing protein n=1 Tax=Parapedobacter composti TaxID=623281 RepID=A0A1I1IK60_9SPHI|nr:hypothetical protein [Parapedobacter composti]SFC36719.1 hypothetical protein SAMN05421747_109123 [Parapedobacter composti]